MSDGLRRGTVRTYSRGVGTIVLDGGGTIQLHGGNIRSFTGAKDEPRCPATGWPMLYPGDRVKVEVSSGYCWKLDEPRVEPPAVVEPVAQPVTLPGAGRPSFEGALDRAVDAHINGREDM